MNSERRSRRRLLFELEELEPRLLFSADPLVATVLTGVSRFLSLRRFEAGGDGIDVITRFLSNQTEHVWPPATT